MKKSRRAALNLSVNAIVVFVLAFAMLGVGVAFINLIREQIMDAGGLIDAEELQNPPSRDNPFTHPQRLSVSVSDTIEFQVGVFNNEAYELEEVMIMLDDDQGVGTEASCLGTGGNPNANFEVIAPGRDISVGERAGFVVSLDPSGAEANARYICTIVAYSEGDDEIVYQGDIIVQTTD